MNLFISKQFILILILISSIIIYFILITTLDSTKIIIYMCSLSLLIFGIYIIRNNYRTKGYIEFVHPIIFHFLFLSYPLIILPIVVINISDPSILLPKSYKYLSSIPLAQFLFFVSILFMYFGFNSKWYSLFIRKYDTKKLWKNKSLLVGISFLITMTIISILDRIYTNTFFFTKTLIDNISNKSSFTTLLSYFGFRGSTFYLLGAIPLLALASAYYKSFIYSLLFYIFLISNVIIGVISGQKEIVFASMIIYFIYLYYYKKNLNRKTEFYMILFVLLFLFLAIFGNIYREILNQNNTMSLSQIINLMNNLKIESFLFPLTRLDFLDVTLTIIEKTPSKIDYLYGDSYIKALQSIYVFIPFIPKPDDFGSFGNIFARTYGLIYYNDIYTGISLPYFAEAYMNFGFFGIPFIVFCYGVLLRVLYEMLKSNSLNLQLISSFLYYIFVVQLISLSISTAMILFMRLVLTLLLLLIILNISIKSYRNE